MKSCVGRLGLRLNSQHQTIYPDDPRRRVMLFVRPRDIFLCHSFLWRTLWVYLNLLIFLWESFTNFHDDSQVGYVETIILLNVVPCPLSIGGWWSSPYIPPLHVHVESQGISDFVHGMIGLWNISLGPRNIVAKLSIVI